MGAAFHLATQGEACLILNSVMVEAVLCPLKTILSLVITLSSLCLA